MNFSDFFWEVKERNVEIDFDQSQAPSSPRLANEAMFHLPLIAITVLVISKGQIKPTVSELGQLVGECFESAFTGFKGSAQHLGWSATLRVRTVQALTFLEAADLAAVDPGTGKISATAAGREVIQRALMAGDDLASSLVAIERSYRNIRVDRQLRSGLL